MLLEPSRFLPATGKWPYSPQDHPFLFLLPPLSLPHSPQIITPTEFFYVRNHLPVPEIDIKNYKLKIQVGRIQIWIQMPLCPDLTPRTTSSRSR